MIIRGAQLPEVPANGLSVAEASAPPRSVDPLHVRAAEEFAEDMAAGRSPSIRVIRAGLHVGQPRAQQVPVYLTGLI